MKHLHLLFAFLMSFFSVTHAQKITNVTAPEVIHQGEKATITINYEIAEDMDISASLQLNSSPWTTYAFSQKTVKAGTNSIDIVLTIPGDIPILIDAYKVAVMLMPIGGNYNNRVDSHTTYNIDVAQSSGPVDKIISYTAPETVYPGQKINIVVDYEISDTRYIQVNFVLNKAPWTNYGSNTVTVNSGKGTENIELSISENIPIENGCYNLSIVILPLEGGWDDRLYSLDKTNLSAVTNTSLSDKSLNSEINIFQNHWNNTLKIKSDTNIHQLTIFNCSGKKIFQNKLNSNNFELNTESFTKGLYLLYLENEEGRQSCHKIVIK